MADVLLSSLVRILSWRSRPYLSHFCSSQRSPKKTNENHNQNWKIKTWVGFPERRIISFLARQYPPAKNIPRQKEDEGERVPFMARKRDGKSFPFQPSEAGGRAERERGAPSRAWGAGKRRRRHVLEEPETTSLREGRPRIIISLASHSAPRQGRRSLDLFMRFLLLTGRWSSLPYASARTKAVCK